MSHPERERKELGAHLARARAEAGYSLQAAADALTRDGFEVKKGTIGAWETGRNVADAIWLRRLARLYGCSLPALVGQSDTSIWPFRRVSVERVKSLEPEDRAYVEGALAKALDDVRLPTTEEALRILRGAEKAPVKPPAKRRRA